MLLVIGCNVTRDCGMQEKIHTWLPETFCVYAHRRGSGVSVLSTVVVCVVELVKKCHGGQKGGSILARLMQQSHRCYGWQHDKFDEAPDRAQNQFKSRKLLCV